MLGNSVTKAPALMKSLYAGVETPSPELEVPVESKWIETNDFGTIGTTGDNLIFKNNNGKWRLSANPYVGLIVFTNVFPFDYKGQLIALLLREDGGIEAFDEEGNRLTDLDHNELFLSYYDEAGYIIANPLSTSDQLYNPDGVDISEAAQLDLTHNTSILTSIGSIQLTDEQERRYVFKHLKTQTLQTQMRLMGATIEWDQGCDKYTDGNICPFFQVAKPKNYPC